MIKRVFLFPFVSLFLVAGVILLLVGSNLYTFHRLTDESPIAELQFRKTGVQEYEVTIAYGDFCHPEKYLLYGDQWRMDAQFLKWRPWANLIGFDSMYRIERLGGRYQDVRNENTRHRVSYKLYPGGLVDLSSMMDSYNGYLSPVDTFYGSSVYDAMQEDTLYRVYRTQSGLLVRKSEPVLVDNIGTGITIEINKACGAKTGWFRGLLHTAANW
jgi:hypothetical protein